ncbi:Cyclic nucleotide-binding domain-containing protein [Rubrivivax sp. A210]|uniref:cyclic nucleotide-binding domain-containing protein n=1 Tax=Rubrivivax sp. A210 TaxID=2772301 RepID=UPI0019188DE6|nr:cyclic nucleotide-binding domain-containing protein [Rubrivivax sp. A210]CAD5369262.1 Cyclic nucleotide-binding domain-containing protein [Rubrivivax sp. A210]
MLPTSTDWLQRVPIFGALGEDSLRVLLERARRVELARGGCLFREGTPAQSMFVLEHGQAAVIKQWQGREQLLRQLQAGDCVGEMALMDLQPRSATVRADSHSVFIEFSTDDLLRLYEHDLEQFALLQMNIGREVCRRLRTTDEALFALSMQLAAREAM